MFKKKFVSIAHVVNDTEPSDHLGGPVSYSSVAAARLGYNAYCITKLPQNHRYIAELENYGVNVILLPSKLNNITTNKNIYDDQGYKKQQKIAEQEDITLNDIKTLPQELFKDAQIVIASDTDEVQEAVIPYLSRLGTVSLIAQGYFRQVNADKTVVPKPWVGKVATMKSLHAVIFGDEDILVNGQVDESTLEQIMIKAHITAFTVGMRGSIITKQNGETLDVKAFPIKEDEIKEFNGAGDTYATGFVIGLAETHDVKEAAIFATIFAGLKLMGFGGLGIDSIPTKEQMKHFLQKNRNRLAAFYKLNNVEKPLHLIDDLL
jgi:sugar/nucleoside kinase (ribokinase family)